MGRFLAKLGPADNFPLTKKGAPFIGSDLASGHCRETW